MTGRDYELLHAAYAGAPGRGIRVTAARGVWRTPDEPWRRFEGPATLAGFVGELTDQDVCLYRGEVCMRVLLGDIAAITDDVAYHELAHPLSLEEALSLASFQLANIAVEEAAA